VQVLRRISVRARLLLLGAAALGILLAFAGFAARSQAKLETTLHLISERFQPAYEASADLRVQSLTLRRFEKDSFLNVTDAKKLKEYREKWQAAYAQAQADLAKLEPLVANAEDRAMLKELRGALKSYRMAMDQVFPLLGSTGPDGITSPEAGNRAMIPHKAAIRAVDATLERFAGAIDARRERAQKELEAQSDRTREMGIWVLLAALLGGGMIFLGTIASISTAVQRILKVLRAIKEGQLSQRVDDTAPDELGEMAGALDSAMNSVESAQHAVQESALAMRRVLDSVEDAMVLIHPDGSLSPERSRCFDEWFGTPSASDTIDSIAQKIDAEVAPQISLGWDQLRDQLLPLDVLVDQMPQKATNNGKHLQLHWCPLVTPQGAFDGVLLLISDVTNEVLQSRARAQQSEVIALLQRHMEDPSAVEDFMAEAEKLADDLHKTDDLLVILRRIHTLKGNSAIFGLEHLSTLCHEIETEIQEAEALATHHPEKIKSALEGPFSQARKLLRGRGEGQLDVHLTELQDVVERLVEDPELKTRLLQWKHEPLQRMFLPLSRDAVRVAERLGKPGLEVAIVDGGLRLPREPWKGLFSSLTHAVRNAIDHGIETPDERAAAGKPANGTLYLSSRMADERHLEISIRDDGRGVDWEKVRTKAAGRGLPVATQQDLIEALFSDGMTTKTIVSEISGRGVGMAALRAEVIALRGKIAVESNIGRGTTVRIEVPTTRMPGRGSIAPAELAAE
jgi:two-component system, chemotaxis family, sensor kinase CheA